MAVEVWAFTATIPAGTPISAPVTVKLTMPVRIVDRIEIKVPPGPRGNMGFALGAAGSRVIPSYGATWLVLDNDDLSWPIEGAIQSGAWELYGYNLGQFAHSIYLRFLVSLPGLALTLAPSLLDLSSLSSGDQGGTAPGPVPPAVLPPLPTFQPPPIATSPAPAPSQAPAAQPEPRAAPAPAPAAAPTSRTAPSSG